MGYYSDVVMAVAVKRAAQADELMAVYALDPIVQKHDLMKDWERTVDNDGAVILYCKHITVKWYEGYEDVGGWMRLLSLAEEFSKERGLDVSNTDPNEVGPMWPYATCFIRIGENLDDVEDRRAGDDPVLEDLLYDIFSVRRELVVDLGE